ncbi:MAG: hypothetical protein WC127_07770 [Acidaminococcaceae bacterium]
MFFNLRHIRQERMAIHALDKNFMLRLLPIIYREWPVGNVHSENKFILSQLIISNYS